MGSWSTHCGKEVFEEKCQKRVRMANIGLALVVVFSFVATGCLGHPGGATRNKCPPKPPTIQEFNVTEYLGIWYEQRRFPAFFQLNTRCVRATYGPCPDPDQPGACDDKPDRVSVLNVATKSNGNLDTILGSAYVPDPEHPGELLVQFPGNPEGSYWMLEHATNVLVENGIDITPLEDTVQNEDCVYE